MTRKETLKKFQRYMEQFTDKDYAKKFTGIVDVSFRDISTEGFVYIAYDLSNNTKIGKAKNVDIRIKNLQRVNPTLKLYGYIKCKNYSKVESILHRYFKHKEVQREWFSITPKEAYEQLISMYDEYGYFEVNPVCVQASVIVNNAMRNKKVLIPSCAVANTDITKGGVVYDL